VAKRQTKKAGDAGGPSYEEVRRRLEEVVGMLERGDSTLEDSLALYEEGVRLVRAAHAILDAAEKRLEILRPGPDGSFRLEDGSAIVLEHKEGEEGEAPSDATPEDGGGK
jgi:exodeoxyribonuclease VII small subunit